MTAFREIAPAKINLALHVRGKLPDGRHAIETLFVFCEDGDVVEAERANDVSLEIAGPFASDLTAGPTNLIIRAARSLRSAGNVSYGAALKLDKQLPVASGLGGGSADAAATLRLLTGLWNVDEVLAREIAPKLGSDVPACLSSWPTTGEGAGDLLSAADPNLGGRPVLLVNPRVPLSTADVFASWDGVDRGPLDDWRYGRNDLEPPAMKLVPQIGTVLGWLHAQSGADFVRMSGSGATCFALFDSEETRDAAAEAVPREWWRLATTLR